MAKQLLPVYSICSLSEAPALKQEIIADHFGHYLAAHTDLHFPHRHSFYHLVYFSKGSGHHSIDFVNFPVQKGQVYFMVPGQVHAWHFKNRPEGFIINFSENYIRSFVSNHRYLDQFSFFSGNAAEQVIQLPPAIQKEAAIILEKIVAESAAADEHKDDMIRAAMLQFFILVSRQAGTTQSNNSYNSLVLKNFKKLVDQHYKEKKLTKEYAALLYVTPNHLNALSKDITGQPAGTLIRDRIILEAKRLLINADLNITEIASELNFEDNSYFSRFFKKYTGNTPEIFRREFETK